MSDLVGNPEDWFSHHEAQIQVVLSEGLLNDRFTTSSRIYGFKEDMNWEVNGYTNWSENKLSELGHEEGVLVSGGMFSSYS